MFPRPTTRFGLLLVLLSAADIIYQVASEEAADGDYAWTWDDCTDSDYHVIYQHRLQIYDAIVVNGYSNSMTSEQACKDLATSRPTAGSYEYRSYYYSGSYRYECRLFRMSFDLLSQYGFFTSNVLSPSSEYTAGSKTCKPTIPSALHNCGDYPVKHEGKYIRLDNNYMIQSIGLSYLPSPDYCYLLCSFYSNCYSVAIRSNYCYLYSTTIEYLTAHPWLSIFVLDNEDYTTYTRYCGQTPYDPNFQPDLSTPTPTKPGPCPTELGDLNNWDLCAPAGTLDRESCQNEGCCYITLPGIYSLCVREKEYY